MASTSANVAVAVKKTCKNHDSYTYSGKEMSPLGLGYTAEAEEVGTVMEGRDKTMWMVGIKNGVRVWNRIPTQVAASVLRPMEKEHPVLAAPVAVAVAEEAPDAPAPAPAPVVAEQPPVVKKAAPVKKVPVKKVVAAPAPVPVVEPVVEEAPAVVVAPEAPKKKAPPKKKVVPIATEAPPAPVADAVEPAAKPEKKRATAFNIYMSWRTFQLKTERPELDHKLRFKQAADEWKTLSDDDKKNALEQAQKWSDEKNA